MKKCLMSLVMLATLMAYLPSAGQDYEVAVTTVNVWIKVVDGEGRPVLGMKKEEFEIFEDGKKMNSECFDEIAIASLEDPHKSVEGSSGASTAAQNFSRRFVLFLDLFNTTQIEYERIRFNMDGFLDQISKLNWEVMLVAYLPSGKLGVISPFTHDFVRIRALLDQAKGNFQRDQRIARNESEILDTLSVIKSQKDAPDQEQSDNGTEELTLASRAERTTTNSTNITQHYFQLAVNNAYRQAQNFASQEKQASEHSFGALESFGEYFSTRLTSKDHTVILFVSGGINVDPGRHYFDLINSFVSRQGENLNTVDFSALYTGSIRENNFDLEQQIQKAIGKLNRYNMTLYAINARGAIGSGPDVIKMDSTNSQVDINLARDYQDSLSQIAQETGGLSFQNSQNFEVGFDSVLTDLNHQYLVCYRPPDHKKQGQYHSIKIISKRAGVNLRHRLGYED
ncbi:MAG TPA: VWA domain-containing protein [Acidobacteriota bacterium]